MKIVFTKLGAFIKILCLITALFIAVSSVVPCLASAVKVPVFTRMPEARTLVAGTESFISASARVFNYDSTDIKYSLEILKGTRFVSTGEFYTAKSGSLVKIDLSTGKGSVFFTGHGIYTARIRAATLDTAGVEIAVGYCPAFEITVLPPVVRSLEADSKNCYGGEFIIRAKLNGYYGDDEKTSISWTVSDGTSVHTLTEGETVNGMVFYGTDSDELKLLGLPQKIFELSFRVAVSREGAAESQVSEEISVMFRPEVTVGFSLGKDGMRFFRGDGNYVTGWMKYNGNVYYFDLESGIMETGVKIIDGKKCLFGVDGRLMLGFYKTPLGYRYVENGGFVEGWHMIDGMYCYFEPYTGYMTARKDAATEEIVYFGDYGCLSCVRTAD